MGNLEKDKEEILSKIEQSYELIKNNKNRPQGESEEQIVKHVKAMLILLAAIDSENFYTTDTKLVKEVYDLALQIIKLELLTNGTSSILNWIKSHKLASFCLNKEIQRDIEKLDNSSIANEIMKSQLKEIQMSDGSCPYVNDGIILYIALQEKYVNLNSYEEQLLNVYKRVLETQTLAKRKEDECSVELNRTYKIKEKIANIDIGKEIGILASSLALLIGLSAGIFHSLITPHKLYKTEKEIYSTSDVIQTSLAPSYEKKIPEFHGIAEIIYEPWQEQPNKPGFYKRYITTYRLNEIPEYDLQDYLQLSESERRSTTTCNRTPEFSQSLDYSYSDNIVEIVEMNQSKNSPIYDGDVPSKIVALSLSIATPIMVLYAVAGIEYYSKKELIMAILKELLDKLEEKETCKKEYDELMKKIKRDQEAFSRLYENSAAYREEFKKLYEEYESQIENSDIKELYLKLGK